MTKYDPHYDYIAIPSVENWFEMRCEPISKIKKAVIELLRKNAIVEGCKIEVRRYMTDKVKQKYIVWNKSKTSVNFVKDDPTVVYKTVTGDMLSEFSSDSAYIKRTVVKLNKNETIGF